MDDIRLEKRRRGFISGRLLRSCLDRNAQRPVLPSQILVCRSIMLPIDIVIAEAIRLGLRVEPPSETHPFGPKSGKWILIQGRRCQVIPATVFNSCSDYPETRTAPLYVPRLDWADFMVYVAVPKSPDDSKTFYVVPRGALSADTSRALDSVFLQKYMNAWELLRTPHPSQALVRRKKVLSPALKALVMEAKRRNLQVQLLRKEKGSRNPLMFQHQAYIEGIPCAVMSATPIRGRQVVVLKRPVNELGAFVVYVVSGAQSNFTAFFVIPTGEVKKTTTRSLTSPWLEPYREAWHLLAAPVA